MNALRYIGFFLRVMNVASTLISVFFFSGSLEVCSHSILIFRGLTCNFFKFNAFPLLKGVQTPLSNSQSVKVTKNVIDF